MLEENQPNNIEDFGLFVGLTAVPVYPNKLSVKQLKDQVIHKTFEGYASELKSTLGKNNNCELYKDLYKPITFYAIGYFNLITLSLIDDYHFGNFTFRPQNRYLDSLVEETNFQYQVINNYNLNSGISNFEDISEYEFLGLCKLKINSSLLIENGNNEILAIKKLILNESEKYNIKLILSEAFSWHELTILMFGDCIESMMTFINNIRIFTRESTLLNDSNFINTFTDTETMYGMNPKLFEDKEFFKNYEKKNKNSNISISTKIQTKTGHANEIKDLIQSNELKGFINQEMRIVNGRSDYSIHYLGNSVSNYLNFWNTILVYPKLEQKLFNNTRKFHSNITLNFTRLRPIDTPDNDYFRKLTEGLVFKFETIKKIELFLKKLHVSKDIASSVLSIFINFNETIKDVNLYFYFLDLRPLLESILAYLTELAEEKNKMYAFENRKNSNISSLLLVYVNNFEIAYSNRFMDSKRIGYNQDIKGDFSGGLHQLIQSIDSCYKIISKAVNLFNNDSKVIPIATFGNYQSGIKSTSLNLHLNYFQIFQPEFMLFSIHKEAFNYFLELTDSKKQNNSNYLDYSLSHIENIKSIISSRLHSIPNINKKKQYYKYLNPQKLKLKINYIWYYTLFLNLVWVDEHADDSTNEKSLECFSFWLWNTFIQNSNLYNSDGSLRIESFREHFFAFYIAIKFGTDIKFDFTKLGEITGSPVIHNYLFQGKVLSEVEAIMKFKKSELEFDIYTPIVFITTKTRKLSTEMIRNVLKANNDYEEIKNIVKEELISMYNKLKPEGSKISTYIRSPKNGDAFTKTNLYAKAVFDPHGGIFVLEADLRKDIFQQRTKIFNKLRNISYAYKKRTFFS